jgi:hypothetical protein
MEIGSSEQQASGGCARGQFDRFFETGCRGIGFIEMQ